MRTESLGPGCWVNTGSAGLLAAVFVTLLSGVSWAQTGGVPRPRSADETVDMALGAIEAPVVQPLLVPPGVQRGIPPFPPYKQEPPAAQRDFRALTSPSSVPPPNPGKSPGGAAGSGGAGSGSPAPPGGGFSPNQPGFPPPDIDPTPPNVPPPPQFPPFPLRPARLR